MSTNQKTTNIEPAVLNEIIHRIVEAVQPEKIILFGSAAHGRRVTWLGLKRESRKPSWRTFVLTRNTHFPTCTISRG
jgi:hypothetical protein